VEGMLHIAPCSPSVRAAAIRRSPYGERPSASPIGRTSPALPGIRGRSRSVAPSPSLAPVRTAARRSMRLHRPAPHRRVERPDHLPGGAPRRGSSRAACSSCAPGCRTAAGRRAVSLAPLSSVSPYPRVDSRIPRA
jgi:hypothetical protein